MEPTVPVPYELRRPQSPFSPERLPRVEVTRGRPFSPPRRHRAGRYYTGASFPGRYDPRTLTMLEVDLQNVIGVEFELHGMTVAVGTLRNTDVPNITIPIHLLVAEGITLCLRNVDLLVIVAAVVILLLELNSPTMCLSTGRSPTPVPRRESGPQVPSRSEPALPRCPSIDEETRLNHLTHEERTTYHCFLPIPCRYNCHRTGSFILILKMYFALLISSGCYHLPSGPFSDDSIVA
jgi:hypothetical protein